MQQDWLSGYDPASAGRAVQAGQEKGSEPSLGLKIATGAVSGLTALATGGTGALILSGLHTMGSLAGGDASAVVNAAAPLLAHKFAGGGSGESKDFVGEALGSMTPRDDPGGLMPSFGGP